MWLAVWVLGCLLIALIIESAPPIYDNQLGLQFVRNSYGYPIDFTIVFRQLPNLRTKVFDGRDEITGSPVCDGRQRSLDVITSRH
jgi:hypothetical protein